MVNCVSTVHIFNFFRKQYLPHEDNEIKFVRYLELFKKFNRQINTKNNVLLNYGLPKENLMRWIYKQFLKFTLLNFFIITACNVTSFGNLAIAQDDSMTSVSSTLSAQLTEISPPSQSPTPRVQPTPTALPTSIHPATLIPTPTKVPIPCNWAQFIEDVTIADGAILFPGAKFTKVWRLKNIGSCPWTTDYDLVFEKGNGMNSTATVPLIDFVSSGTTSDLAIKFTAPSSPGHYRGYWKLRDSNGIIFGIGPSSEEAFWVDINVQKPNENYAYDFAINYCAANWLTPTKDLTCPSSTLNDKNGSVSFMANPELENRSENEPALLVHPDHNVSGYIMGIYPPFAVEDGDRFKAWVGCMDESDGCDVIFKLEYKINGGSLLTFAEWYEAFDGAVTIIDIDLSSLAGKDVQFVLSTVVNGGTPKNANGFWFVPHILRD